MQTLSRLYVDSISELEQLSLRVAAAVADVALRGAGSLTYGSVWASGYPAMSGCRTTTARFVYKRMQHSDYIPW